MMEKIFVGIAGDFGRLHFNAFALDDLSWIEGDPGVGHARDVLHQAGLGVEAALGQRDVSLDQGPFRGTDLAVRIDGDCSLGTFGAFEFEVKAALGLYCSVGDLELHVGVRDLHDLLAGHSVKVVALLAGVALVAVVAGVTGADLGVLGADLAGFVADFSRRRASG